MNIFMVAGWLYIILHIIMFLMLTIITSSIWYSYCMCYIDWEKNEFTRTIEHFRGFGGTTTYTRPKICVY